MPIEEKAKYLLENSIDCALLGVEIYNKPRAPFRYESFITHMIIAWTILLHAHFISTIGETYFYPDKLNPKEYLLIEGEKKAWELITCIAKYGQLSEPVKKNLEFFITLRNKIEHHFIEKSDIGIKIFGECQSLLYNYENELIKLFGQEYALNENLAYSLQFSSVRTDEQKLANSQRLLHECKEIKEFIEKFRDNIKEDIYASQEFSIKLIQVPKISNTNRNDLAIEYLNWNSLSEDNKKKLEKLYVLVKDKIKKVEVINPDGFKPGEVIEEVNRKSQIKLNHTEHKRILSIFSIRPYKEFGNGIEIAAFETNTDYCLYDETHQDYVYKQCWIDLLVKNLNANTLSKEIWKNAYDERKKLDVKTLEVEINFEVAIR